MFHVTFVTALYPMPAPLAHLGADPSLGLAEHTLDRGVRLLGHPLSLSGLFTRLESGAPITLGVLGASVGQNGGCLLQHGKRCMGYRGKRNTPTGFAVRLLRHINRTWPHPEHAIANAALDGTGAEHTAHCIVSHLPLRLDIVIAEWGSMALHTVWALHSIERVARVLLSRPAPPVLLHLSVHEWCTQRTSPRSLYKVGDVLKGSLRQWVFPDTPWAAVEEESTRVSCHYGQPSISVHAALAPHVLAHEPGFSLEDITGPDCLHPVNGKRGVDLVEALLTHWLARSHALWNHARTSRPDMLATGPLGLGAGVLPSALHASNADPNLHTKCYAFMHEYETNVRQAIMQPIHWCSSSQAAPSWRAASASNKCWQSVKTACPKAIDVKGGATARLVARAAASQASYAAFVAHPPGNWFYCGVSLGEARRKISAGVVAMVPGAQLRARVDGWTVAAEATMSLEHLVSYEGMGTARLECVDGCECAPQRIDAHKTNEIRNVSVFESHSFPVRAARARLFAADGTPEQWKCEVMITLLQETRTGSHKFKVRSLEVTSSLPTGK